MGAPNHCGGRRRAQQCCKYFLQQNPCFLRFEHSGAKLVSCPGRHLTSLRTSTQYCTFLWGIKSANLNKEEAKSSPSYLKQRSLYMRNFHKHAKSSKDGENVPLTMRYHGNSKLFFREDFRTNNFLDACLQIGVSWSMCEWITMTSKVALSTSDTELISTKFRLFHISFTSLLLPVWQSK